MMGGSCEGGGRRVAKLEVYSKRKGRGWRYMLTSLSPKTFASSLTHGARALGWGAG